MAGRERGVFILLEHDPESGEENEDKDRWREQRGQKKRKAAEGQMEMKCTSRI